MTTTPTTGLADMLHAKAAEVAAPDGLAQLEYIPPVADSNGEIVPASQQEDQPSSPSPGTASPGTAVTPAPPTELPIPFPEIPPKVIGGLPYAAQYAKLARTISQTEMVPGVMRGRWDAVTACFMRGYEMGLGPMQALDSFHVIDGKVGLTAEAMRALIIQEGHQILLEDLYHAETQEFLGVKARCRRKDWAPDMWMEYRFTLADANQAGLMRPSRSGKPSNWQTYPRAMCDARATSGAGRRYFPDVLAGMSYTPEEIRDFDGPGEAPEQEATPSPSATETQNGATPTAPAASPAPPPSPSLEETMQSSSPPLADALKASLATAPESTPAAGSTDSASATSPADTAAPAPPTASSSTAKKAPATKKAAAKKSAAAPTAAPPAAATPSDAPSSTPSDPPSAGEGSVLVQMRQALTEIIKGQPQTQQPLLRAFLQSHWPNASELDTEEKIQKAIDIAVGWPDSADQHPPPLRGEEVHAGFSTRVVKVGEEYICTCTLCSWELPEAATNTMLPDFRRLELAKQTAQQHETGEYEDGMPFCPARPAQGRLEGA